MATREDISFTTTMMVLFFGTNLFLYLLFFLVKKKSGGGDSKSKHAKAFDPSLEGYTLLTTELFLLGMIMLATYIFENHWIFDHSQKEYSRDLFAFVILVFFIYGYYTIKPVTDLTMLSREQTEEWKGWMQFIFLLYHYFHAEEVYNSIRVMITCYVWMTGFGNFSFFYMSQDFGWLRLVQMLWRLNFAVFFLVLTHGNTYILYYICPLHTFYFLMTYVTMFIMNSVNHDKWKIRYKLLCVGIVIYIVWDLNSTVFDFLFGWLGTEKEIGATNGSLWEWYFRSSLDHWSTYFGMIFALNFPIAEQLFKVGQGYPLILVACIFTVVSVWWFNNIYMLEKLEYNLAHSYFAFIPLLSYIFFRNITPGIRSQVSMSFHDLGKTTLETYLLQHHVWLTSNAKTLLTLVPGHPWVNFAITTVMFFLLAKELYRLTMTLRGMIIPDDKSKALRNMTGSAVVLMLVCMIASFLHNFEYATISGCALTCFVLYLLCIVYVSVFGVFSTAENENFLFVRKFLTLILFALTISICLLSSLTTASAGASNTNIPQTKLPCKDLASSGHWVVTNECNAHIESVTSAACTSSVWEWNSANAMKSCQFHSFNQMDSITTFKNKQVLFIGDSTIRNIYHMFNAQFDDGSSIAGGRHYNIVASMMGHEKHSDLTNVIEKYNITVKFIWMPYIRNITELVMMSTASSPTATSFSIVNYDFVVMGGGAWDALHFHDIGRFEADVNELSNAFSISKYSSFFKNNVVFVSPLRVIDIFLNSPDKSLYMKESVMMDYRAILKDKSTMSSNLYYILASDDVTKGREDSASIDGVHYSSDIYSAISQIITNVYRMKFPARVVSSSSKGKPTGSMSDPWLGGLTLLAAAVMLFTMDSFFGFGTIALAVFGRKLNWEEAYDPYIKKVAAKKSSEVHGAQNQHHSRESKSQVTTANSLSRGVDDTEERNPLLEENDSKL